MKPKVKPGIEVFLSKYARNYRRKRFGLITNPTGIDSQLHSSVDLLYQCKDIKLVSLYGPEHGIRGDIFAGKHIENENDPKTNLPVFSLYGATRKPTPEMLKDIDVLVFDIQDVGARYYTYVYTMAYAMQTAKELGIEFMVFDRPNPLNGELIDGPTLDPRYSSFIGLYPIPIVHGLTVGELARFFNKEFNIGVKLTVVPMQGWKRKMQFEQTGLPWVLTSPQIPQPSTCWHYVITGFMGELLSLSTGVGYTLPFEIVGAPWLKAAEFSAQLNKRKLPGVLFRPLYFRPYFFKFADEPCGGVQIHITDRNLLKPVEVGMTVFAELVKQYPDAGIFEVTPERLKMYYQATGSDLYHHALLKGTPASQLIRSWKKDLVRFAKTRQSYLLYK